MQKRGQSNNVYFELIRGVYTDNNESSMVTISIISSNLTIEDIPQMFGYIPASFRFFVIAAMIALPTPLPSSA